MMGQGQDRRIWEVDQHGNFSVQSFCQTLLTKGKVPWMHHKVWMGVSPLKVKFFGWIVGLKKILTIDNLRLRKMTIVNACPLCLLDAESLDRLLLDCHNSYQIWIHFFQLLDIAFYIPRSWCQLFNEEIIFSGSSFPRNLWSTTIMSVIWSIWMERNKRIFQGQEYSVMHILDIIKLRTAWWMVGSSKYKRLSITEVC